MGMRKQIMGITIMLAVLLASLNAWAVEALEGVYDCPRLGRLRIVVKDDATYRIDRTEPEGEITSFIATGGRRWIVLEYYDGEWGLLDYDALVKNDDAPDLSAAAAIMEGANRTVAGFKGRVLRVGHSGQTDLEVVVTDDADVVVVSEKLLDLLKNIGYDDARLAVNVIARQGEEQGRRLGLLQWSDANGYACGYELKSLKRDDFPDIYFALPVNVKMLTERDLRVY